MQDKGRAARTRKLPMSRSAAGAVHGSLLFISVARTGRHYPLGPKPVVTRRRARYGQQQLEAEAGDRIEFTERRRKEMRSDEHPFSLDSGLQAATLRA